MKKVITIALLLVFALCSHAQDIFNKGRYLDTIRIECDKIDIEFLCKYQPERIATEHEKAEIDLSNTLDILKYLKIFLAKHKTEIETYDPVEIVYHENFPNQSLSFRKAEPQKEFYGSDIIPSKIKRQNVLKMYISINRPLFLTIRFSTINDLIEFDFAKAMQQLAGQSIKTHWYPELFEFTYKNDILEPDKFFKMFKIETDSYLSSIDFYTGLSLLKQKPTIDFGIGINLIIAKEQFNNVCLLKKFSLSYRYITYYDEITQKAKFNGFLNGMYTLNFPRTKQWIGAEAGYLLQRNGYLFDKNTIRLALVFTGGKIDFSPGIFISSKSVVPSISVAFTGVIKRENKKVLPC
jgi:hypothetical protein